MSKIKHIAIAALLVTTVFASILPVSVFATVTGNDFTLPEGYTLGETVELSTNVAEAGQFYAGGTGWTMTALTEGDPAYPPGGDGIVMRLASVSSTQNPNGFAAYSLPPMQGETVTLEARVYRYTLEHNATQQIHLGSGISGAAAAYFSFGNDGKLKYYSGGSQVNFVGEPTFSNGWNTIKIVLSRSGSNVGGYDRAEYYFNGEPLETGSGMTVRSMIRGAVDSVRFTLGAAANSILIDYIKVTSYDPPVPELDKLQTPQKPIWLGNILQWNKVEDASQYLISLYKDGVLAKTVNTPAISYIFTNDMEISGSGRYTATVQAVGDNITWSDSDPSALSEVNEYRVSEETIVFHDDFEEPKYSLGLLEGQNTAAWPGFGDMIYTVIPPTQAPTPNYPHGNLVEIKLKDGGSGGNVMRDFNAQTRNLTLSMRTYITNLVPLNLYLFADSSPAFNAAFRADGTFKTHNGTTMVDLSSIARYKNNDWNDLEIMIFKSDNMVSHYDSVVVKLNGETFTEGTFRAKTDFFNRFAIGTPANAPLYLDDLKLTSRPLNANPYPMALSVGYDADSTGLLIGKYTYYSSTNNDEGASRYRWLRADRSSGPYIPIPGETGVLYKVPLSETNKYYKFEVTPVDVMGVEGSTVESGGSQPMFQPVAENVYYTDVDGTLTGKYTYYCYGDLAEGNSKFRWYISSTVDGIFIPISGADSLTYRPTELQKGKYFVFEVIPVTLYGRSGVSARSTSSSGGTVGEDSEIILAAKELTFSVLSTESNSRVTKNLTLPLSGSYQTSISWQSSNPEIISRTGVVNRPEYGSNKLVTLIATLVKGDEQYTQTYKVIVLSKDPYTTSKEKPTSSVIHYTGNTVPLSSIFSDVPDNHWAKEYIEALFYMGAVSGVTKDTFEPERAVTREEFCAVIVRMFGLSQSAEYYFNDVPTDSWYYDSVRAAVESGIVYGESESIFGAGKQITRQDAAVMAARLSETLGYDFGKHDKTIGFVDSEDIADYAKESVANLVSGNILGGYETGKFMPRNTLNRAEMAKMLYGLYRLIK